MGESGSILLLGKELFHINHNRNPKIPSLFLDASHLLIIEMSSRRQQCKAGSAANLDLIQQSKQTMSTVPIRGDIWGYSPLPGSFVRLYFENGDLYYHVGAARLIDGWRGR